MLNQADLSRLEAQHLERVDGLTLAADFEMQLWAGNIARHTDVSQNLPGLELLPLTDDQAVEVGVG